MMEGAGQKTLLNMNASSASRSQRIESSGPETQPGEAAVYFSGSGIRVVQPCGTAVTLDQRRNVDVELRPAGNERHQARKCAGDVSSGYSKVSVVAVPPRMSTDLKEQGREPDKASGIVESMEITPEGAFSGRVPEVQNSDFLAGCRLQSRSEASGRQKKEQGSEFKETAYCDASSDQSDELILEALSEKLKDARSKSTFEKLSGIIAGSEVVPGEKDDVLTVKRMIDRLKNFECVLHVVNEWKDTDGNNNGNSPSDVDASVNHPIIKLFKTSIENGELRAGSVYEGVFYFSHVSGEIQLSLMHTVPVTKQTPQPVTGNPFDEAFVNAGSNLSVITEGRRSINGMNSDAFSFIKLGPDCFKNPRLYSALVERINDLSQQYVGKDEACGVIRMLIRFRNDIPHDQKASKMNHRLGASRKEPREFYRSETLRLPWSDTSYPKYLEIQVPFVDEIPVNVSDLIDPLREPLSNLKLLGWEPEEPESINTKKNRKVLRDETSPAVRNMNPADPKNNGLAGDYRGMGIGVNVSDHTKFPSLVFKSGTISLNPTQLTVAHITSKITCTLNQGLSKAARVLNINFGYHPSDGFSVGMSDNTLNRRKYNVSESDGVQEAGFDSDIQLPLNVIEGKQFDDGRRLVKGSGAVFLKDSVIAEENNAETSPEGISISHKKNRYALLQTRFLEKEMLGNRITDPSIPPLVVLDGLCLELLAMYLVRDINALMEIPGFKRITKFYIDGNPDNYVIREGRFALIDQTPANSSVNDSVFPGNQFLTRAWFKRRADFNHKLSTVFEFGLFFEPVMLFRLSRQVDEDYRVLIHEGIVDKRLKYEVDRHNYIMDTLLGWCAFDDELMRWVVSCFLPFVSEKLTLDMFEGDGAASFFERAFDCFNKFVTGEHPPENLEVDLSALDYLSKIKLLRVCVNVVYKYLGEIKADEKCFLQERNRLAEPYRGIGSGLGNDGWYSDSEVFAFVSNITNREVKNYIGSLGDVENDFYRVVLESVKILRKTLPFPRSVRNIEWGRVEDFKDSLTAASAKIALSRENSKSLPVLQKALSQVLGTQIDFIVIRPFCGSEKEIRTQMYSWSQSSDTVDEIDVNEFIGNEQHNECIGRIKRPTIILVNHRVNSPYLVRDVDQFRCSALFLGSERPVSAPAYALKLPISYAQEITASEQVLFDGFLSEFEKLYHELAGKSVSAAGDSKPSFLEKMMRHLPADCGEWQEPSNGVGRACISMRLSPNKISGIPLLLRVFHDVLREEKCQLPSRMYVFMKHPDPQRGYYVRWTFRVFGEFPCTNFRRPFKPKALEDDLGTSETANVICFIVRGKKGLSTGDVFDIKGETVSISGFRGYKTDYLIKPEDMNDVARVAPHRRSGYYEDADHLNSLEGLRYIDPDNADP